MILQTVLGLGFMPQIPCLTSDDSADSGPSSRT